MKRFERVQKDKSRGEGSSGKSTEEEFHESSRKRNVSNHYFNKYVICAWVVVEWGNTTAPMAAIPGTE